MPTISSASTPASKGCDQFKDIFKLAQEAARRNNFSCHYRHEKWQNGVDIYGKNANGNYVGMHCKNISAGVSKPVIDSEICFAESFNPGISTLYIAMTAPRDVRMQWYARKVTEARKSKGQFSVELLFWKISLSFCRKTNLHSSRIIYNLRRRD